MSPSAIALVVGVVAVIAGVGGAVGSRQWTLASFRKLAREAGVEGALNDVLKKRAEAEARRAAARRRRWTRARLQEWARRKSAGSD